MVPNGWSLKKLKDISIGRLNNGIFNAPDLVGSGYKLINVVDIYEPREINTKKLRLLSATQKDFDKFRVEIGDLFFTRSSLRLAGIAHCNRYRSNDTDVMWECHIMRCKPNKKLADTDFLYEYCHGYDAKKHFMRFAKTGTMTTIDQAGIGDLEVQLPPLPEQRKIATILGIWDKAISTIERLIDNSKQQKKALMQQLLTGKKRLLDDSGKMFGDEWNEFIVGNVAKLTAGGTPNTKQPEYWGGNISWMSSGEVNLKQVFSVKGRITELGLKKSSTKDIPENSILIALAGQGKTRGTVAINRIKLCTNQSIAAIMPDEKRLDAEFLYFNLDFRYQELRAMSTGDGGRGGLNLSILKSIKLKLPSVKEQKKIADVLTNMDREIKLLEKQLADLKQEKKALMQQLLTGKRRVRI
jgi:type I restriction enzyme S subunit